MKTSYRSILAVVALAIFTVSTATVQAQFNYVTTNGTITITKYTGLGGNVTIPSTINDLPVTSIGDLAFSGCTSLISVTIPDSVTSIGEGAFRGCTSLTMIMVEPLNPSYSSLDGVLFNKNQTMLIRCPWGKTGSYAIPDSVTNIGGWAFYGCSSLTSATIPNSVTSIGWRAFSGFTSLPSVTIPDSVTSIGISAFEGCYGLTNVTIGRNVTNISLGNYGLWGSSAFGGCTNLTGITVDDLNTTYSSVDGVLFDKSQTALVLCPRPTAGSYSIPPGITSIGPYAFVLCFGLTNLTFPASVTSIAGGQYGGCPFYTCSLLSSVYFEGDAPEDWAVFECVPATLYHLPGTAGWATTFSKRPTALWVLPYPVILTTTPSFGIQTNAFGFRISWATNTPVVVEASTSLVNPTWSPVSTNILNGGWTDFRDPEWANSHSRFYRVRSQ